MRTKNSDDEGYKRFLAFLASSPNHEEKAAAAKAPPSMPMLTMSESEDHEHELSAAATLSWEEEEGKKDTVGESVGLIFQQVGNGIGVHGVGEGKSSDQLERVHQIGLKRQIYRRRRRRITSS
eukprot:scaffold21998_cov96-Skeletonema_dohrnii-CCMP3373.AAC.2